VPAQSIHLSCSREKETKEDDNLMAPDGASRATLTLTALDEMAKHKISGYARRYIVVVMK